MFLPAEKCLWRLASPSNDVGVLHLVELSREIGAAHSLITNDPFVSMTRAEKFLEKRISLDVREDFGPFGFPHVDGLGHFDAAQEDGPLKDFGAHRLSKV